MLEKAGPALMGQWGSTRPDMFPRQAPCAGAGLARALMGFGCVCVCVCLRWTLKKAGPAFMKWGQWGSTRPDLFPR